MVKEMEPEQYQDFMKEIRALCDLESSRFTMGCTGAVLSYFAELGTLKKMPSQKEWNIGMNVELEHGKLDQDTNITEDDPILTAKIAAAHINERADYYRALAECVEPELQEEF
jgi:hypothetical protein